MIEYTAQSALQWSRLGSRRALGSVMGELAGEHPELMVMAADVASSSGLNDFAALYPDQFINAGIAEMNMLGMAAGMAAEGHHVIAVSFAPFASMRCFEVARSYLGYMNLPVVLVGIASGFSMGVAGNTHYGLEDLSLMRTIPNMTVLSPADCTETVKAIEAALRLQGPAYIRLTGISGQPIIYKGDYNFTVGEGIVHGEGRDVAFLATGPMVYECIRATRLLAKEGIQACTADIHTIKPLDTALLQDLCVCKLLVTVEEHFLSGGLGSAVVEYLTDAGCMIPVLRLGVADRFGHAAQYGALLEECGLTARQIASAARERLQL